MSHYLVAGDEARLMSTWRRSDKLVLVWVRDAAKWVETKDILIVGDIADEGVSNSVSEANNEDCTTLMVCSCHGTLVWDIHLLDVKEQCPLSGSAYSQQAWADAMGWVSPAAA